MKATELMIGDWVEVTNSDYLKFVQVDGILGNSIFTKEAEYESEEIDINDLRTIPLTSEILEKNSFLKVEAIEYPSNSVGISFLYRNTPEGLRIFVQNACVGGPTCTMIKTCKYVHEVQHMIKMCDIERTFVL